MNFIENHLKQIQRILDSNQGIFQKLEQVGSYLIETHQLASIGIFRRVGDEFDDHVFITEQEFSKRFSMDNDWVEHYPQPIKIIRSRYVKPRQHVTPGEPISEFIFPILCMEQIVGILHAEKKQGSRFTTREIKLLEETANLIGRIFLPSVIHLN